MFLFILICNKKSVFISMSFTLIIYALRICVFYTGGEKERQVILVEKVEKQLIESGDDDIEKVMKT